MLETVSDIYNFILFVSAYDGFKHGSLICFIKSMKDNECAFYFRSSGAIWCLQECILTCFTCCCLLHFLTGRFFCPFSPFFCYFHQCQLHYLTLFQQLQLCKPRPLLRIHKKDISKGITMYCVNEKDGWERNRE